MKVLGVNSDFKSFKFSHRVRWGSLTFAISLTPLSIIAQEESKYRYEYRYEYRYSQEYYDSDAIEQSSKSLPKLLNQNIEQKINIEKRIVELARLAYNWDGKGALPIEQDVILNIRAIFDNLSPEYASLWRIFPDTNGTIMLVHKKPNIGTVSIGNKDFSYFAYNKNGKSIVGEHPYSIESINSTIKEIETLFE